MIGVSSCPSRRPSLFTLEECSVVSLGTRTLSQSPEAHRKNGWYLPPGHQFGVCLGREFPAALLL